MARIRIDDLPVAEHLTPEQEALIQGAGLKSFRPTLEALEDRQMMSANPAGITFTRAVVSNKTVLADQAMSNLENPSVQLDKAPPPHLTPIDLQGGGSSGTSSSSGTPSRAAADSLFATKGIASAFRLGNDTRGQDQIANFHVFAWGTLTTAGVGAPGLKDLMSRNIDLRAAVERILADPSTPWHVTAERIVAEADRR
jgi:hypothetical protein